MTTEREHDASIGELLGELVRNISTLIRGEVALVRLELGRAVGHFGAVAAMLIVAGLLALCGYIFFLLMLHSLFVQLLGPWIGELVVMAILLATAGIFVFLAKRKLDRWKVGGGHEDPVAKVSRPKASAANEPAAEVRNDVN